MVLGPSGTSIYLLPLLLLSLALAPAQAAPTQPSIPIAGRYSVLAVKINIPSYPKWAHDVVLNATVAWNQAQLWYVQNNPTARVYTFTEADDGTATSTVSFSMPAAFASIAVGWTMYCFASGSRTSIVSTQTYLTPSVFNDAQGGNVTAEKYGFWLALHELGRVLGLGSVLDGKDIMEPRYTSERVSEVPRLSTLDLYALHVLAQGGTPTSVTLPDGVQDQFAPATVFLNHFQVMITPMPGLAQSTATTVQASQPTVTIPNVRYVRLWLLFRLFPV